MRGAIAVVVAVVVALAPAVARADGAAGEAAAKRKRKVAVLEFRGGARGASELGQRMALILRQATSLVVSDPDDARRTLGPKIDEELARCAGDAACVARIGARLGVDEVLLVGISELGDLIVALQRVDVRTRAVASRIAESLPPDTEPDDATIERWLRRLMPPEDFRRYGTIRVRSNVDGALVRVGGEARGTTPIAPIVVEAPARIEVRVTKKGYVEFVARIDVPPDATVEVTPELSRRGAADAWQKKWWVWALAGTLLTGAVVMGVVLGQDEPTGVPISVHF